MRFKASISARDPGSGAGDDVSDILLCFKGEMKKEISLVQEVK
jgi:hypothetical protein